MFETVDHIAFAVRDIEEAIAFYSKMFDVVDWERIPMPERHQIAASTRVGGFTIELIAPTSDEAAFAKYRATPEYRLVNHAMDLAAFKGIFWWEYFHRLLGRLIGVVFFVPPAVRSEYVHVSKM